ncbi:hypothetical protein [Streptomyces sp. NPDC002054]|uniref:hypothetical protein n=1 Tax=Streptomyces sp. NPDC002054 TaxID=3154663 RepID=UPI00332A9FE4
MITMYAWPSTADGPDALPMVHFTTEEQSGSETTPDGQPVWLFDSAIRDGGWAHFTDYDGWSQTAPGWLAEYRRHDDVLLVSGPGACEGWYQGTIGAPAAWIAAAATQQSMVIMAAPVPHPSMYGYAVEMGVAFALLVPVNVV